MRQPQNEPPPLTSTMNRAQTTRRTVVIPADGYTDAFISCLLSHARWVNGGLASQRNGEISSHPQQLVSICERLMTISRIAELVTLKLSNRYLTPNTMSLMIGTADRYTGICTCACFARQPCHLPTIATRSGMKRAKNWSHSMPDTNGFN